MVVSLPGCGAVLQIQSFEDGILAKTLFDVQHGFLEFSLPCMGSVSLFFLLFLCRVVRKQVNLLRQILRHRRLVQQVIGAEGQPTGQQGFIYDPVIQAGGCLEQLLAGGSISAAIRAVVRTAMKNSIECVGIRRGWAGLIAGDICPMNSGSVSRIINRGGTVLYTARSDEFRTPEGQKKAANTCKLLGLDGIVAIGGDGTFRGAQDLSRFGVSVVGVPGTIDNDIVCTDYTIGFDTAANTAVECIDRLRDTMQSHERCSVVEVMGRRAGYLALYVGVAVGATAVLVPEHQYDFEKHVAEKIRAARLGGKTNFMIVVAEGAASAMDVGKEIKEHLGLDPRVTILGHIQRGGSPTAKDRVLATRMGYEAVRVLAEGMTNRVICVRDDQIVNVDIDEGLAMKKTLNAEEFEVMTVMTGV